MCLWTYWMLSCGHSLKPVVTKRWSHWPLLNKSGHVTVDGLACIWPAAIWCKWIRIIYNWLIYYNPWRLKWPKKFWVSRPHNGMPHFPRLAGIVLLPATMQLTSRDILHRLQKSRASCIIVGEAIADKVDAVSVIENYMPWLGHRDSVALETVQVCHRNRNIPRMWLTAVLFSLLTVYVVLWLINCRFHIAFGTFSVSLMTHNAALAKLPPEVCNSHALLQYSGVTSLWGRPFRWHCTCNVLYMHTQV